MDKTVKPRGLSPRYFTLELMHLPPDCLPAQWSWSNCTRGTRSLYCVAAIAPRGRAVRTGTGCRPPGCSEGCAEHTMWPHTSRTMAIGKCPTWVQSTTT